MSSTMILRSFLLARSWKEFGIDSKAGKVRYEVKLPVYELIKMTLIKNQIARKRRRAKVLPELYSAKPN